jgi:SNF2 family DNA or RNA helicase
MNYRDYQKSIINKSLDVLKQHGFVYLAMEVRTGKTLTALGIASMFSETKNVLFVTKKKAISSIDRDYALLKPSYYLHTINYESLHKIPSELKWDFIVLDEAHSLGAFPKPSKRAKEARMLIIKNKAKVILLSGTPTPESYSQMYHQVYGIPNNPFKEYKSFYRFCDKYVDVKERIINSLRIRDYSRGSKAILEQMKPYTISYSQKEAGFKVDTV